MDIRDTTPSDLDELGTVYRDAFPDEDLVPLVKALHEFETGIVSLAAVGHDRIAGHVIFTMARVEGDISGVAALLGPLAVAPAAQRQGTGTALVRAGIKRMGDAGVRRIYVLGDPGYYRRFGFSAEYDVTPPYPLPDAWRDAWQSSGITNGDPALTGTLHLPQPWLRRELWTP